MLVFKSKGAVGRRGSVLLQAVVALMVMGGLTSLSVDVGLFYTAKLELQRAADAAALAAAADVNGGGTSATAAALAVNYAQANSVVGESIQTPSVETILLGQVGGVYVANVTPVRAVKVCLRRTRTAGNPVRLYFAQFLGLDSIDASAAAIAKIRPATPAYMIAGIDQVTFGSAGVLARVTGRVVSNGPIDIGMPLGVLVGVQGDVRSFAGVVRKGSAALITGSTAHLSDELYYPPATLPLRNDDAAIAACLDACGNFTAAVSATVPAGTYVVHDLNLLAGVAIDLQGPVTFYVQGDVNIGVAVSLLGTTTFAPASFKVRVVGSGAVTFVAPVHAPLNMDLYAPQSNITVAVGVNAYKGRLIGKTLNVALPVLGNFTEDTTLGDALAGLPPLALTR